MADLNLKQVIAMLRSGEWNDVHVFTANQEKKTGGEILHLPKCRIARHQSSGASGTASPTTPKGSTANHNKHFTLNMEMENGEIRKIHPLLVFKINNHQVI